MIIDTKKIEKLLADTTVSGDTIEFETGIRKKSISNYRTGKAVFKNMTLETAEKLQKFAVEIENNDKFKIDVKIKGLKKAVGDFNKWQGSAIVYFNKKELTIWTRVYTSPSSFYNYHDYNIVEVLQKATSVMAESDDKTNMRALQSLCVERLSIDK